MGTKRRHLRFLISSALLVGPALGCGPTPQVNPVAPIEEIPAGNPGEPEPETVEPEPRTNERPIEEPVAQPEPSTDEMPMEPEPPPTTNVGGR